jgi:hypothetical protein
MWIPGPFYERAPHYWLFMGLLLVVLGIYLGIELNRAFLYAGVALGAASCGWAIRVFQHRAASERRQPDIAEATSD